MLEDQENKHDLLDGNHQANDCPDIDWKLLKENKDTSKPYNQQRSNNEQ